MNPQTDRREISRLLAPHFPITARGAANIEGGATSDEWHIALDKITMLETPLDMPNGTAFDRWRQALAAQGYDVWGYSPNEKERIAVEVEKLLQKEAQRLADEPALLAELAKEAPLVTAAELLKVK